MKPSCRLVFVLVFALGVILRFSNPSTAAAAESDEAQLLAGADQRIEQHRKAEATIVVTDAAGKPLPGAKVLIRQTRHAFLFGCNIFKWEGVPDETRQAAYRQQFAELLNFATLPFYWAAYEPQLDQPQHDSRERVAQWCRQQGIATKGHPLMWNYADPKWLPDDAGEIHRRQLARIDDCVKRFAGLIERWDVVNEATHFDRDEFVKRAPKMTGMWKKYGQIELTRECFEHARRANPGATLLINDYRVDPPYEKVIEQLVDKDGKRLYDVIGIQSHMHGGAWPTKRIWEVCERFSRFGVPLHFTEATILSGERTFNRDPKLEWPSTPEGEAYQAREAARFYTMLFSHPAVEAVTWWDFSDFHAWKRAPAGLIRADMTPKPAYEELKRLIKGKWWTTADTQTGADGTARLRGFLGDYEVTVEAGGQKVSSSHTLKKDGENRWKLSLR